MRMDRALELIKREGRTREWLANKCGIEVVSLNHILSGRRSPGRPVLILMAQELNTTPEYLTGETDESQPKTEHKAASG